ncbi:conjugal transfer protein TraI [Paraflavisolibacter sp. H34]|uniref:conjugal transfer protein TraI n=1 Tax=Huijunlia imazamoxiresistens TaxID=3127457 RepID=UPI003018AC11
MIVIWGLFFSARASAQDPITLIIKEGIKKVIKAVDLKIQRLQTKTIWLQNAQKVVENRMVKLKLDEISDWAEKQRALYKDYFEELHRAKGVLVVYGRTREIFRKQVQLVEEYKRAVGLFRKDRHFTGEEITYMEAVYSGILEKSLEDLERISLAIESFSIQMSDAARLEIINKVTDAIEQNYDDLKRFTNQNALLSLSRAKEARDIESIRILYNLQ